MGMEQDRAARRAKVRAMMAERNAGTKQVRMTVEAKDVQVGDWAYRIHPIRAYGDRGPVRVRGVEFNDGDGARVTTAGWHRMVSYITPSLTGTEDGNIALGVEDAHPYKVPAWHHVDIMRRVPVDTAS